MSRKHGNARYFPYFASRQKMSRGKYEIWIVLWNCEFSYTLEGFRKGAKSKGRNQKYEFN